MEFVLELLHSVFGKQLADAFRFIESVDKYGKATCGIYPRDVAKELLEAARQRIRTSGHPLQITTKASAEGDEIPDDRCKLCGEFSGTNQLCLKGTAALVCDDCMDEVTSNLPNVARKKQFDYACDALAWHFAGIPLDQLVATSRQFPGHMRADVQVAIDKLFSASPLRFFGIHEEHRYETLTIAGLTRSAAMPLPSRRRSITRWMSAKACR